jgi:hypothetical protein
METRRIRRLERRRAHRTAVMATLAAVFGIAVGLALPQNRTAALVLVMCAACCAAIVTLRDERRAPLHGLHEVVRLPLHHSLSLTLASFWSRAVGTLRAATRRPPELVPILLDESDAEAEAWWGPTAAPASSVSTPSSTPPSRPSRPSSGPALPAPVVAAPVRSAHVSVES